MGVVKVEETIISVNLPSLIFSNRKFSVLEALVLHLKENLHFSYSQIARLLNRDDRTIWTVYKRTQIKKGISDDHKDVEIKNQDKKEHNNPIISVKVPSYIFTNRNFAVLESLVLYLKEEFELTYSQIAKLINRDDRTIWTAYNRANKKQNRIQNENK